jgi:hypothetical protein
MESNRKESKVPDAKGTWRACYDQTSKVVTTTIRLRLRRQLTRTASTFAFGGRRKDAQNHYMSHAME